MGAVMKRRNYFRLVPLTIPGFARRICPTSGAMVTTNLRTLSSEIADQIITHTGDVPAIYSKGAHIRDARCDEKMNALENIRGIK